MLTTAHLAMPSKWQYGFEKVDLAAQFAMFTGQIWKEGWLEQGPVVTSSPQQLLVVGTSCPVCLLKPGDNKRD